MKNVKFWLKQLKILDEIRKNQTNLFKTTFARVSPAVKNV